ncbi:MAG: glycosyltransferase family 2 protein [Fidelibacterota bacterium]
MVSIIIPHWNGVDILEECLSSLLQTRYADREIIVVDNASTDDSVATIKTSFPSVIVVENDENRGYAGGCNTGAAQAQGDILVFLNNDTVQDPGWLEPLVNIFTHDSAVAAVQPKIKNYYQRDLFDYAGGAGGEMDMFCFPFARGRIFTTLEEDKGQYDDSIPIFWASGTALAVRAAVFKAAGGFDESFFAHMEEIDLCWRFHLMNYTVRSAPASVVYHKNAVTLPATSAKKYYLNHRNSLVMLLTNYRLPATIYLFPIRFGLELLALLYALIQRDWNHIAGILRALVWVVFHPGYIRRKRRKVQRLRNRTDREIMGKMYSGSIVVAYYLLRRKFYSDI